MSLISKDFRLQEKREEQHGHARLRWALFAIACAGIGAVIASTNTEESRVTAETATSALPELVAAKKSPEELARDSFALTLPELQARQNLNNEDNASDPELSPKQWRQFTVKSGDSLARLFKRADIKPQQLDELMKSGDAVKKLRRIFPKKTIRILSDNDGVLQELRYDIDKKSWNWLTFLAGTSTLHSTSVKVITSPSCMKSSIKMARRFQMAKSWLLIL
jgi:hypothetical protein